MALFRQFRALVRKNFLVAVWRRPVEFFVLTYGLPLVLTIVLLYIFRWFDFTSGSYGISSPSPIRDFPSSVGKKILISRPDSLASDIDGVIDKFTKPLDNKLVQIVKSENDISNICIADTKGISPCHAAVSFYDTPKTEDGNQLDKEYANNPDRNHTWSYQVLYEPIKFGGIDPNSHDNSAESYMLPLQLALYHSMMNTSEVPELYAYSPDTKKDLERRKREIRASSIGSILGTPLFIAICFIIYRHATLITADRESGMPQLVDAMGGSEAVFARVLSWLLVFNVTTLPFFIISGVVYHVTIYQSSPVSLLIGWQILIGLAVNSTCIFAASFFRSARVSSVYIIIPYLVVAAVVQMLGANSPPGSTAYAMSFLFTSSNFVIFLINMSEWEKQGNSYSLSELMYDSQRNVEGYPITGSVLLGFLILHILIFPALAILVEKYRHGIDFKNRTLAKTPSEGVIAAETINLYKRFDPSWLAKVFCCGKRRPVHAVNGVNLQGHKGQILCLVGPNGSGKTTTLHMMAGFISPTSGSVNIGVPASHLGLCPQRNTLWGDLTVKEHVELWCQIKDSNETPQELDQLLVACDLAKKVNSKSKTLSIGQQRKLQLACMFVGGSSLCLIDECTSGLDPLSRRVIWDILLEQRTKRSIILTTHFLDEVDVLADHITILSKGEVKCHGATTQLKNIHGGGYRVLIPQTAAASVTGIDHQFSFHQDRAVYHVPDSRQAAKLSSKLSKQGIKDISIAGPQVEDVFLNVAEDHELDLFKRKSTPADDKFELTPGRTLSFKSQVWVLFKKRIVILKKLWFPYFLVLFFPFLVTPLLKDTLKHYDKPSCANPKSDPYYGSPSFSYSEYCMQSRDYRCPRLALGPSSANETLYHVLQANYSSVEAVNNTYYYDWVAVQNDANEFSDYVSTNLGNVTGGIYMGSEGQAPILAAATGGSGSDILNLWAKMVAGQDFDISYGVLAQLEKPTGDSGIMYVIWFTLMQALYPTFFVLYPSLEKARKVRSVQYTNGVRHAPLWLAYGLFDFIFVLIISLGITGLMSSQMYWLASIWIMFPILALYGLAAILLGYLLSHFITGSLKTFLAMAGFNVISFMIAAFAFALGVQNAPVEKMEQVADTITFTANFFLPIANVFRAGMLNLNVMFVTCREGKLMSPGLIYAYGGPILYLFLQVMVLFLLVVWLEGDIALFQRKREGLQKDNKLFTGLMSEGVAAEEKRVEENETDLLRILHVDKWFGKNHAVNNVTLGLPKNDVTALIGPNGAGKSTLVNIVQSELRPNNGRVLLCGEDSRNRTAQKFLGICPQYDALDMMTTREQLSFYAQIKGIKNVKENVEFVMTKLGLTPHASTYSSKLSGGNKRKLSLGIALMGTPAVIVLDEPTSAMDAIAKRGFWQVIKDITPGRTVLLTTHSMEEADTLGTRCAIMSERLLAVGTTQELRERYSNVNYVSLLLSSAPHSTAGEMELVRDWVFDNVNGAKLERNMMGGQVQFTMPGSDEEGFSPVPKLVTRLEKTKKELGVDYYSISGATLERVFLGVVRENHIEEDDQKTQYQEEGGILMKRLFKR